MNKNEWNKMRLAVYRDFISQKYGKEKERELEIAISNKHLENKLLEYRSSEKLCKELNHVLFDE